MRDALFIAREDLLQLLRQREVLLWVFVMPGLFFYFIGSVTGGAASPAGSAERPDPLVMVTPVADDWLVEGLARRLKAGNFDVRLAARGDDLGDVPLKLEVVAGSGDEAPSARVARGERVSLRLTNDHQALGAELFQLRVARAVYATAADLVLVTEEGAALTAATVSEMQSRHNPFSLEVSAAGDRGQSPLGFEQAIPGIIVMFTMLVLLTTGTHMMTVERELGLLRRLASTPISRSSIVLGKWLGRMALGVVQIGLGMVLGTVLFGIAWSRGLPVLIGVLLAWAAFNGALAILLANLVEKAAHGASLGMLLTMVMAALGGCWWPMEVTPGWMQAVGLSLPSGWAMDAMHRVVSFGQPGTAVLPHVAAMIVAALLCARWAAWRFRYQ